MKRSGVISVLAALFSLAHTIAMGLDFESSSFDFYEELTKNSSQQCRIDANKLLYGTKNMEKWALEIIDSSAKVPSGILRGNLNQFGDFDECVNADNGKEIYGKYCLAIVELKHPIYSDYINAHDQIKNNLNDNNRGQRVHPRYLFYNESRENCLLVCTTQYDGQRYFEHDFQGMKGSGKCHLMPKFSSAYWGLCVPLSCAPDDVTSAARSAAPKFYDVKVLVENDMCQIKRVPIKSYNLEQACLITAITLILGIILWTEIGQTTSFIRVLKNSFSIKSNFNSLFVPSTRNEMKSLEGIRVLNMIILLLFHMTYTKMFLPYFNKTELSEDTSKPWTITFRVFVLYTESFLAISGVLAAKTLSRFSPIKSVISRYIRLTAPLVVTLIILNNYIAEMNSGPMWNMMVRRHVDLCQKHWWKNLLYIQNLFGFENTCMGHTHHLATDFQLFVMVIPLTYLLQKSKAIGLFVIFATMSASTLLRFQVNRNNDLASITYFGISSNFSSYFNRGISKKFKKNLFVTFFPVVFFSCSFFRTLLSGILQITRTFDLTYFRPTHRANVYLMGYLVGYWMQKHGRLNLSRTLIKILWLVAVFCGLFAVFWPYNQSKMNYVYDSMHSAIFNSVSPILWSIFILWCVIATENGQGGWIGKLLCWDPFIFFSNISYSVYLVQLPVFFYILGTARGPLLYTLATIMDVGQLILIIGLSIIMTLFVDIPFRKIAKHLTR